MVARRSQSESDRERSEDDLPDAAIDDPSESEELRLLRAELKDAGGRLLTTSAHGIRNHITIIQSYLEIIHSDLTAGLSDEQLSFLGIAYDHVLRLRNLIDDLVLIGALETGISDLNPTRVDIGQAVTGVCTNTHEAAQRQRVTLRCEIENDQAVAEVDFDHYCDITRRLLDNALKFTPEGGTIVVRVFSEPAWATMSISDTGVGIPAECLGDVFDLFTQFHLRPGEPKESHGLGLPLVRRLVEASGGNISLESTVGGGTVATVRLPAI